MATLLGRSGRETRAPRHGKSRRGRVPVRLLCIIRVLGGEGQLGPLSLYPPRTRYSDNNPTITTAPPIARTLRSGIASNCSAARFQLPGAAKRNKPSITATRHSAAHRSSMLDTSRSAIAAHVLQERVVALQHDHRFAVGERLAVRLQAAMEGVEPGIPAVGLRVHARGFGIALAAQFLRVA